MSFVRRTIVLTGGRAGQTCTLSHGRFRFTDGQLVLQGDGAKVAAYVRILATRYQAYELGSTELEAAQHGEHNLQATAQPDNQEPPLLGGDQPSEPRAAASEAHDGGGPDGTDEGQARLRAAGHGHEDARLQRIQVALGKLDQEKDAHWTSEGLPKVKVVARIARIEDITRADILKAAPDLKR